MTVSSLAWFVAAAVALVIVTVASAGAVNVVDHWFTG
jgi:hypothetical protein